MDASLLKLAVVTGGKTHDVIGFQQLFRHLAGIDVYVQHIDDFAAEQEAVRDSYDVILFYLMMLDGPTDEGMHGYQGHPRTAFERLGRMDQGIVLLHHAILAYPNWGVWDDMTGMTDRTIAGYSHDERLTIQVADTTHPITQGLADWSMIDETYDMHDATGDGNNILLTVDHADSMHTVAWTRQHGRSRVFCLQLGHDNQAWIDENFQTLLRRGIFWSSRRM